MVFFIARLNKLYIFEHRMNIVCLQEETELLLANDKLLHSDKD